MFHKDPDSNSAIIRSLLRKTVAKLQQRLSSIRRLQRCDQSKLDLLTLHETNPVEYEELCDEIETNLESSNYKVEVIEEIIRRKTR